MRKEGTCSTRAGILVLAPYRLYCENKLFLLKFLLNCVYVINDQCDQRLKFDLLILIYNTQDAFLKGSRFSLTFLTVLNFFYQLVHKCHGDKQAHFTNYDTQVTKVSCLNFRIKNITKH